MPPPLVPTATVRVAPSAAKRLNNAYAWVFRDEMVRIQGSPESGDLVLLETARGETLGIGWYSATSHITVRLASRTLRALDEQWLPAMLRAAVDRRAPLTETDAMRLVYAEADGLPGLIVDRYAEYLVIQLRHPGMARWREAIVDSLNALVHPRGMLERSDMESQSHEGLPPVTQVLRGEVPARLQIREGPLRFWVDPHRGHKTGFYLDQRELRAALRAMPASGRVCDLFAYTGSLGIAAAAGGAAAVTCVEQDEPQLALAREQAALNGVAERVECVAGDVFYWLDFKANSGEPYDGVIVDPPGLAKSKADSGAGRRKLQSLLIGALRIVKPGGWCSVSLCTYHLLPVFEECLRIAGFETQRRLTVIRQCLQGADHPWILQQPETLYLRTLILRVE